MTLIPLVVDFEAAFDGKLTLKKLSYSEYVRHPDFLLFGGSVWLDPANHPDGQRFLTPEQLTEFFDSLDWSQILLIAHNMKFDGFVIHEIFRKRPAAWACTLAMSEAIHQGVIGNSLEEVAEHYDLPAKGDTMDKLKSVRELTPEQLQEVADYCNNDTLLCWLIYQILAPQLPADEHTLLSLTEMLFCAPLLEVDLERAQAALDAEKQAEAALLERVGLTVKELRTAEVFAQALRDCGVEPPTKYSVAQRKMVYAFAKTDLEFTDLEHHENARIRDLFAAKQLVSSTISQSRAQRLIDAGTTGDRKLPICLHNYRAHTGRWSGGNKMNPQNFKRGSELRKCMKAPPGHAVVVADSSQIECRKNAWLNDEESLLAIFRDKRDPYCEQASQIYNMPINKKDHSDERFIGKVTELGLGYQMGGRTFQRQLATGAMGQAVQLPLEECNRIVYSVYRPSRPGIVAGWRRAEDDWLRHMCFFAGYPDLEYKCLRIDANLKRIWLPNGMYLSYPQLRHNPLTDGYEFWNGKFWKSVYGGLVIENVVQALARIAVAEQSLKIAAELRLITLTHDEVVALAPIHEADQALRFMIDTMSSPPSWASNVPLAAEGGWDVCYSK